MAPSVTLDLTSDFNAPPVNSNKTAAPPRTLLLAPPSISSHPEALDQIFQAHDRNATDIQMLDRLALGLASLPDATYDLVLLLTDADGTRRESQKLLGRHIMGKVVQALKAGGTVRSQDGSFASTDSVERTEAILAGLVSEGGEGMKKPEDSVSQTVSLGLRKKANALGGPTGPGALQSAADPVLLASNGKRKSFADEPTRPPGVGFVDFSDDFGEPIIDGEDDELIDEDSLLTEADMARPIAQRKSLQTLIWALRSDLIYKQLLSVNPKPANADEPAKTAPVALNRSLKPKMQQNVQQRRRPCRR